MNKSPPFLGRCLGHSALHKISCDFAHAHFGHELFNKCLYVPPCRRLVERLEALESARRPHPLLAHAVASVFASKSWHPASALLKAMLRGMGHAASLPPHAPWQDPLARGSQVGAGSLYASVSAWASQSAHFTHQSVWKYMRILGLNCTALYLPFLTLSDPTLTFPASHCSQPLHIIALLLCLT